MSLFILKSSAKRKIPRLRIRYNKLRKKKKAQPQKVTPTLPVIYTVTLRHLVERRNCFFNAGKLCVCVLHRLQLHRNVSKNREEVSLRSFGQND